MSNRAFDITGLEHQTPPKFGIEETREFDDDGVLEMFEISVLLFVLEPIWNGRDMNRPWEGKGASGLPDQLLRRGPAVGVVRLGFVSLALPSSLFTL